MKKSKIKAPITKGVCKVPVIIQLEALECGAASLAMVLAYYGKWIPLEQVRLDCGVSRDGSNAKNVLKAARYHGLNAKGYRFDAQTIKQKGKFPCIIHWNFNHFVVLDGFKGDTVYLNDPAVGNTTVTMEVFEESFTGIAILLEPSEEFVPSGKPKSMFEFAKKRLAGSRVAIAFTVMTLIVSSLIAVIDPAFSRVFIDRLISGKSPQWSGVFFVLLAIFIGIKLIVSALSEIYSRRIEGKMAAIGNSTYMWKVLHLPLEFFSQRMAGDIQGRQATNASIAKSLIDTIAPLVINIIMSVFYFVVMLKYSVWLTIIGLFAMLMNAIVARFVSNKRINIVRRTTRDTAKMSATSVAGIEMIETIKSAGAENGFFTKWSGLQASVNTGNAQYMKFDAYLGIIPELVTLLLNNLVLFVGALLTMRGEFTEGMILAFQGLLAMFTAPMSSLISAGQTFQEMRTNMERVDDVMEYREDKPFAENTNEASQKLTGNLELKNIVFGYSPLADPLIKDFNLTLTPGKSVAFVGGSGCGKSTMSKLISGLTKPWSGEILFDGKPMSEIEESVFHGSLAVVDQDIILFEDTIANNIKMWDESIEDFEMILAARDAQIHNDIMDRPGGYSYKLLEGGKDFSGGQKQRIEIARVLAQDPTIIILDEATSALDAKTEYEVVKSIRDRGITCIVVAHRLSTIRSCDEIIVMNEGNIVDRGTHSELLEKCELYKQLVTSE